MVLSLWATLMLTPLEPAAIDTRYTAAWMRWWSTRITQHDALPLAAQLKPDAVAANLVLTLASALASELLGPALLGSRAKPALGGGAVREPV